MRGGALCASSACEEQRCSSRLRSSEQDGASIKQSSPFLLSGQKPGTWGLGWVGTWVWRRGKPYLWRLRGAWAALMGTTSLCHGAVTEQPPQAEDNSNIICLKYVKLHLCPWWLLAPLYNSQWNACCIIAIFCQQIFEKICAQHQVLLQNNPVFGTHLLSGRKLVALRGRTGRKKVKKFLTSYNKMVSCGTVSAQST